MLLLPPFSPQKVTRKPNPPRNIQPPVSSLNFFSRLELPSLTNPFHSHWMRIKLSTESFTNKNTEASSLTALKRCDWSVVGVSCSDTARCQPQMIICYHANTLSLDLDLPKVREPDSWVFYISQGIAPRNCQISNLILDGTKRFPCCNCGRRDNATWSDKHAIRARRHSLPLGR